MVEGTDSGKGPESVSGPSVTDREVVIFPEDRDPTDCPLCGQPAALFQKDGVEHHSGIDILVCKECEFAFQHPIPSQEDLVEYYRSAYRESGGFVATPEENFAKQSTLAEVRWDRYMKEYFGPEVIALDVACGTGNMMRLMAHEGAQVMGVEAYEPYAEKAREFGIVQTSMVEDMQLAQQFNTVLLIHILEHLRNPAQFLTNLRPYLTPGTRLWVECPSLKNVVINGFKYREDFPRFAKPHLWEFSPASLKTLLEGLGWVMEAVIPYQRAGLTNHLWRLFQINTESEECGFSLGCQKPVMEALATADAAYRHALEKRDLADTVLCRAVLP